jgi:hypothetical protein
VAGGGPLGEVLSDVAVSGCYGVRVKVHQRGGRFAAAAPSG